MQKVAIIGCGGAGKSTLARQLGEILDIPVHHLDKMYWKPNWTPTLPEEWEAIQANLVQEATWIIDGNYSGTMHLRLHSADTVIFLDYSTLLCLYRIFKRRWMYQGKTRVDMAEGCVEKVDRQFINWVLTYRRTRRPKIIQKLDALKTAKTIHIFTTPAQANQFLHQLQKGKM